jgi:hypothetical protein
MKALSVIELSKLYGMTRQALYKQVNKGNLTKNSDGKIDLAEAIRVFGEPSKCVNSKQTTNTQKLSEVHLLEQQVYMLQKQLEIAQEREQFQRDELKAKNNQLQAKDEQIESLQRLLGAPKPQEVNVTTDPIFESNQQEKVPEPKPVMMEQSSKKRGFFGRLVQAVFEE